MAAEKTSRAKKAALKPMQQVISLAQVAFINDSRALKSSFRIIDTYLDMDLNIWIQTKPVIYYCQQNLKVTITLLMTPYDSIVYIYYIAHQFQLRICTHVVEKNENMTICF